MTDDTPKRSTIALISGVVVIAALLLAAVAVYPSDLSISDSLQQSQITRTGFGRTLQLLGKFDIAFCFMFFVCWATGNRRLLWRFGWAGAASGIIVLLVKLAVARARPNGAPLSFPSGDTSIAFVWAVIIAVEYPLAAVPALLAASTIGFMRVTAGLHYPSDVFAGAAIGFTAAEVAVYTIRNNVPRWFYRVTRRTRLGLLMVAFFLGGIAGRTVGSRYWPLVLAVVIVLVVMVPVLIAKRGAWAKLTRKPKT